MFNNNNRATGIDDDDDDDDESIARVMQADEDEVFAKDLQRKMQTDGERSHSLFCRSCNSHSVTHPRRTQPHNIHIWHNNNNLLDMLSRLVLSGRARARGRGTGLIANQLNALPTRVYNSAHQQSVIGNARAAVTDDTECVICLEQFTGGENLRFLPCCHKYHRRCIDNWLKRKATCPICNFEIRDELRQ